MLHFFLLLSLFFITELKAEELKEVQVISVYDGDTFTIEIPKLPKVFGHKLPVRVYGIDTPELKSKDPCERKLALEARNLTRSLILGKRVRLYHIDRDKYFRVLAEVQVGDMYLKDALIEKGLAQPYFGKTKNAVWNCY